MMSKSDEIQMRLVLRGDRLDVSAVLLLAAENGLLVGMEVIDPEPGPTGPPKVRSNGSRGRPFNPGTHVVVRRPDTTRYPAAVGNRRGSVVRSVRRGKGYGVEVKWDDDPAQIDFVASSLLKVTNPR